MMEPAPVPRRGRGIADSGQLETDWAFDVDETREFHIAATDENLLGGGAYGAVYEATLHGRKVAAKTLHMLSRPDLYGLTGRHAEVRELRRSSREAALVVARLSVAVIRGCSVWLSH